MSSVSIADMERVAMGGDTLRMGGNDIGDVIELGDLNDDLGLSMLMNPSKANISTSREQSSSRVIQMNSVPEQSSFTQSPSVSFGSSSQSVSINAVPLEPLEPISFGSDSQTIDMNRPRVLEFNWLLQQGTLRPRKRRRVII